MTTRSISLAIRALVVTLGGSAMACAVASGPEATGQTEEAAVCLTCGSSSGGASSGGDDEPTITYETSCKQIMGTASAFTSWNGVPGKLPFVTQQWPSSATVAGWSQYSLASYETTKANIDSACASGNGLGCLLGVLVEAAVYMPWVFENQLADALQAAGVSNVGQTEPLLLASNDPTAADGYWYGLQITEAVATGASLQNLVTTWDGYANQTNSANIFVAPQIFSCQYLEYRGSEYVGSEAPVYYVAWDPNCGDSSCGVTLSPRSSGITLE